MKKHRGLKIALLVIVLLLLLAPAGAWFMFGTQIRTAGTVEKPEENLDTLAYQGDYDSDDLTAGESVMPPVTLQTPPAEDPERLAAYRFALEQIAFEHVYPDGTDTGFDGALGFIEDNHFALRDVTGDGAEELIIQFVTAPMAGNAETVYTWREGALTSILTVFPSTTYYENGVVKGLWSHGDYLAGDEWPYNLYQYDAASGTYELLAEVNMWSRAVDTVNYKGDPYPEDIDTEGAGVVYILTRNGVTETVSKSDYEGWLADILGNAAELEIPYQAMTEENIKACGVR